MFMTKAVIDWTKTFCLKLCVITNRDKHVQVARYMVLTREGCLQEAFAVCAEWQSALEWTVAGVFAERYFRAYRHLIVSALLLITKPCYSWSQRGEGHWALVPVTAKSSAFVTRLLVLQRKMVPGIVHVSINTVLKCGSRRIAMSLRPTWAK